MKAIVYGKYGKPDVLKMQEVDNPKIKEGCVIVEIHYTSVTAADVTMRKAETLLSRLFLGLFRPSRKILGTEFSGKVVSVGEKVKKFKNGDSVYGFTGFKLGAYAEFTCLSENASIAEIPEGISYSDAVCMADGATTALFFLSRKTQLEKGSSILIIGASGSIGTYAVQVAKNSHVSITGVCSGNNAELVRQLGADAVVDYTKENFLTSEEKWDVIFDSIGKYSYKQCRHLLNDGGRFISTRGGPGELLFGSLLNRFRKKKYICGMSVNKTRELELLNRLVENNCIHAIVDREYPLENIVEAHTYVESGHKKGNVVIKVKRNAT